MEKKVKILLLISALIIILNVFLLVRYTGNAINSTAQGTINLIIEGAVSACGDGTCDTGAGETCSTCPADCGSCPVTPPTGGGGGAGAVIRDFYVDTPIINVMTKIGESFKTGITIKNTENIPQNFKLVTSQSLSGLVFLSEDTLRLEPGEEKIIYLTFVSSEYTEPGVYSGNLMISTSSNTKTIPVIYTIKTKMVLFDISLDIPARYKEILPGEEMLLQLTLFNLGEVGKTDVSIEYIIKDFEGNIIMEESGIVAVETQVSFSKMIKLSSTIKPGDYVVIAQARYDASLGSSSVMFHVIEKKLEIIFFLTNKYFIIVVVVILLAAVFILFLEHERKKMRDVLKIQTREIRQIHERIKKTKHKKGKKIVVKEAGEIKNKLRNQFEALENAYKRGYITRDSYLKGKERLENFSKKLKGKYL